MSSHEMMDQAALYALDALSGTELAEFESHLDGCHRCRAELVMYQSVAADLVYDDRLGREQTRRYLALGMSKKQAKVNFYRSERLPWDFIDHRIAKQYLWIERRKALAARQTAPCDTATCTTCAAC